MSMYNKLTPAQTERLYLLLEEMGEAQQAIGKVLRHGYEETHPDGGPTNRESLERELGDVAAAVHMLAVKLDVRLELVYDRSEAKAESVKQWLHHQEEQS